MNSRDVRLFQKFSERCIEIFHLRSIKGKIFTLFAVSLLSITALTMLNFWNLSMLRTRLMLSERYDDLLNNILEVRRFEKNYLIYGDKQSIEDGMDYLNQIDALVDGLGDDLLLLTGTQSFTMFRNTLAGYRNLIAGISRGEHIPADSLRNTGKALTVTADQFRAIKRERIHATIVRTSILPFAFFCILLPLMSLVLWLIFHGLLRPLNVIVETTQLVGRGDFRPIRYEGVQLEEISGLIEAFNGMANELESNQEDLIQARKIAAIGTFTAGIAHELNNPINNIVLTAEAFAEEHNELMNSHCQEMIRDIISQAERAAEIVKNLLDFSRTEHPSLTDIAPSHIVNSSINLLKNQIRIEKIDLETSLAGNLSLIRGNLLNLQQVFTNLLLNAIQATPPGGKISIAVYRSDDPAYIEFVVEDTGPGIPEEIRHKIFEPFFSTKEVGKGTGLGLSVCYSIVRRHGGMIKVASGNGHGARFTILLPAVPEIPTNDFAGWTAS